MYFNSNCEIFTLQLVVKLVLPAALICKEIVKMLLVAFTLRMLAENCFTLLINSIFNLMKCDFCPFKIYQLLWEKNI